MKRLLLAGILAVVAGCDLLTGGNDDTAPDGTLKASTYLPLKTGVSRTYSYVDSTGALFLTRTEAIIGQVTESSKTCWQIRTTYRDGYVDSGLVRLDGDIFYELSTADYKRKPATSWYQEIPQYKFGIRPGTTWTTVHWMTGAGTNSITGKYIGLETVTSPCGTFENCARFEFSCTYTFDDSGTMQTSTETETHWLAPNIGLVKTSRRVQTGAREETFTYVLTDYTIPAD